MVLIRYLTYLHLLPTYIWYREDYNLLLRVISFISWYIKCILYDICQNLVKNVYLFVCLNLYFIWYIVSQFHDLNYKLLMSHPVHLLDHTYLNYLFHIKLILIIVFNYGIKFLLSYSLIHVTCVWFKSVFDAQRN